MDKKAEALLITKKEWVVPTCKSFGKVEDLTLNPQKGGSVNPNSGQPFGAKCGKRAGCKDCSWSW